MLADETAVGWSQNNVRSKISQPSPQIEYNHPPLQAEWIDVPHQMLALGEFSLESGETIRNFELSWVMHGKPNAAVSNVVLCMTPIGSNHHKYDALIGPGRALDTDRFCIVVADAIGNGLTTSPSTSFVQAGEKFPRFTIRDMVETQKLLLDHLGVRQLHAAFGASMGGMQVLQWAVSYPQRLARGIAMVPMAKTTPWSAIVNEASRRALMADPDWADGNPERGWSAWSCVMQALAVRTPEAMRETCRNASEAINWIADRTRARALTGFRAVDWVYQTYAYDAHDVSGPDVFGGDLATALGRVTAEMLIISAPNDLYNPTYAAREAAELIPGAVYYEMDSVFGHHATNMLNEQDLASLQLQVSDFLVQ
jgi:homoserine O-acetyltransferase/O-succinyltransferase